MRFACLLVCTLLMFGCGTRNESVLEWPELKALDMEVEELEGLLGGDPDPAAMAEHLPHVQAALEALFASEIPAKADNPDLVKQKLEELESLATEVGDNADVLKALHPLVASIMEPAGMPHVHDEHDHDHAHGDHDHAH
jgi:hypothetical protein